MTNENFMPLITLPTRIAKNSRTLIDNIFYNQFQNDIISGNLTVGISDHLPQFALVPGYTKNNQTDKEIIKKVRKFKNIDNDKFNEDLQRIDWTLNETDNLDQYGSNFLNIFNQILDIHAPKITIKQSPIQTKQKAKPWINNNIRKLIKIRDKTYSKFIKEKNEESRQKLLNEYKSKKNEITKLIRSSKKAYYNEYFSRNNKNIKNSGQESIKY